MDGGGIDDDETRVGTCEQSINADYKACYFIIDYGYSSLLLTLPNLSLEFPLGLNWSKPIDEIRANGILWVGLVDSNTGDFG
jgi:hypothetical protein